MSTNIADLVVENSITLSGGAVAAPVSQTPDQANAAGTATSIPRSDHVHNIPTAAASTQTPDQANAQGAAATFARADHVHNIPTAAATGLNAGSTNTQGAAATFARADHTHAIASGTPSTQNPDQSNATGSSTNFARADHIHNVPTAAASSISTSSTNTQGSSTSFARADHTHAVSNTRYHTETSAANQAITSATFVDVTNATLTATDAGTYLIMYEGEFTFSNASRTLDIIVNSGGSTITLTQRTATSAAGGQISCVGTHTVITVTAGTVVKIQAQISSNTVNVNNQALTLLKIA